MKRSFIFDGGIKFPSWVKPATPCRTITHKHVIARGHEHLGSPHGAMVYYETYTPTPCSVTGILECRERSCELHYTFAPLNLGVQK